MIFSFQIFCKLLGIIVRIILENDVDITVNHEFICLDDITKVGLLLPSQSGYPGIDTGIFEKCLAGTTAVWRVLHDIFPELVTRLISPVRPIIPHTPVPMYC